MVDLLIHNYVVLVSKVTILLCTGCMYTGGKIGVSMLGGGVQRFLALTPSWPSTALKSLLFCTFCNFVYKG